MPITLVDGQPVRTPDFLNPAAQRYARARLRHYGVNVPPGVDPTQLWRAVSAQVFQGRFPLGEQDVTLTGPGFDVQPPPEATYQQTPFGFGRQPTRAASDSLAQLFRAAGALPASRPPVVPSSVLAAFLRALAQASPGFAPRFGGPNVPQ